MEKSNETIRLISEPPEKPECKRCCNRRHQGRNTQTGFYVPCTCVLRHLFIVIAVKEEAVKEVAKNKAKGAGMSLLQTRRLSIRMVELYKSKATLGGMPSTTMFDMAIKRIKEESEQARQKAV